MAVSTAKGALKRTAYLAGQADLKFPNPGDIFIMVAFAWAAVCFLLVIGGEQITRRLSLLTGSRAVRDLLLTEQTAIGGLMIAGIVGLAVSFYLIGRFRQASTGFCSGWMRIRGQRRRRGYDRGFVLSDHADWPSLLRTVEETGASRVLATHGHTDALVRLLRERGVDAAALETLYEGSGDDQ